jgi:TRAP transporter TAXI family solute receptor
MHACRLHGGVGCPGSRPGDSAFALAQADVALAAFDGTGPFAAAGADPKLRLLIALHPEAFTVVARGDADVREFQDLRGRRVGVGKSGAGYPFTRDVVLAAYGWTTADLGPMLELDPGEQEQALCSNRVDAVFFVAGHPNGVTQGVTSGCGARLVRVAGPPVDRLVAKHSWYLASFIPRGVYPGNPDDVPTIATRAVLLASSDLPDELAHAAVKAVFGNFADFRRLHPVLSSLELTRMVPRAGVIPIHPGALAYYREAGLAR